MCILRVRGEVDTSNSLALEAAIAGASQAHRGVVLVSFVECTFADCSCLSVLIRQFKTLPQRLMIVAPPASRLRRLLDLASLAAALPVYDGLRPAKHAMAPDSGDSAGAPAAWKSSEKKRVRLDEMTFTLRGSPRFQPACALKVSS
jgi:anti-anti-sigma factor